ncbi:hypothetical protein JZ751_005474 [Albula glossodonta]|uniref:Uncharacterized protein n=1 Tax=Albula glossodonta TaxID=121402 RepID=A0A8T2MN11_9TELE|nr:hypothetical protein JZ751_005474 [Albula glossodonta]
MCSTHALWPSLDWPPDPKDLLADLRVPQCSGLPEYEVNTGPRLNDATSAGWNSSVSNPRPYCSAL